MAGPASVSRLIVNADDFGRSPSINKAVVRAHREGILTSASLMVNEPCAADAVRLARDNPKLGIGLHLSLVYGAAALPREKIPALADARGKFRSAPVAAGCRYFFDDNCRSQLAMEIEEQFNRFHATGLKLDHVNGHLNIHLHPVIFGILLDNAERWGIRAMRLTCDNFAFSVRSSSGNWAYRISHAAIFGLLSSWAGPRLDAKNIRHTDAVFGLLQNGRVDADYLQELLPALPPGDSELYSHPSLDHFKHEFDALISPATRDLVQQRSVQLIRYQDLQT